MVTKLDQRSCLSKIGDRNSMKCFRLLVKKLHWKEMIYGMSDNWKSLSLSLRKWVGNLIALENKQFKYASQKSI